MPWQSALPSPGEASLNAIVALMQAKVTDLNTALASVSPAISLGVTVDSTFFGRGDPDTMPDVAVKPFWVTVVGGGKQDGRDSETTIKQSGPGYWYSLFHNVYFYLHPNSFPSTDAFAQADTRELFRARVVDWMLYDVFNNATNYTVTLGSRQFSTAPAYDTLDESFVTDVSKGFVLKSFGTTQYVYMAHLTHRGKLYGGN